MTEPKDMYLSSGQPHDDLLRDYLADFPMKIYKNGSGEVVKIETIKPTATFVKTFEGLTSGQVITETVVISGWKRKDKYGASDIDGIGDLEADGVGVFLGGAAATAQGDVEVTANAVGVFHGGAVVTEYGDVAADGIGVFHGGAASSEFGDVAAGGVGVYHGEAGASGQGDLEAECIGVAPGEAGIEAYGDVEVLNA